MTDPWRDPAEESDDLYPGLVVSDDRVTGSITAGRSRLPLWVVVPTAAIQGWSEVEKGWEPSVYGWTADKTGEFLGHLLEQRGEFGRLLLVLADVERREDEQGQDGLPWWELDASRQRVVEQLRRCLAALEGPAELDRLHALAAELADFALDAAGQGSSAELSEPTWHSFISTWERADDLFRRPDFQALLQADVRGWIVKELAAADETRRARAAALAGGDEDA